MANEKKMTKRDYFNEILALEGITDEQKAFINHEIELLDKKNSAVKKPTANQTANIGVKASLLNAMADGKLYTVTELTKLVEGDLTNQKVSALLRQMLGENTVERVEDKRKAYFRKLVAVDTATDEGADEE